MTEANETSAAATAKLHYVRIAPRKLRVIANMVRGQPVAQAINHLRFLNRAGSREFFKLLVSAVANAEDQGDIDVDGLVVRTVMVDQGPALRRWRPRAHGRATQVKKFTSHVFVEIAPAAAN
ncbi:MAG: 50S ribosomal protein L22 [Nannocystales bacterium]